MLICASLFVLICCLLGFFSYRSDVYIRRVLTPNLCKTFHKMQSLINWILCVALMVLAAVNYLFAEKLTLGGLFLFLTIIFINSVYVVIVAILSYKIIKKASVANMRVFLLEHKDSEFQNDQELIHSFCREYRGFDKKEAERALKIIRKAT